MAPGKRRTATSKRKTRGEEPAIVLRSSSGVAFPLQNLDQLPRLAMNWVYTINRRRRWAGSDDARHRVSDQAYEDLLVLGLDDQKLSQLAEAGVVEVDVKWGSETRGWAGRIFPWEYVISAATRRHRGSHRFTVVRRMDRRVQGSAPAELSRVLYVESAPGLLGEGYDFDAERALLRESFADYHEIVNPTPEDLRKEILAVKPHVLHLSGFDAHQGRLRLQEQQGGSLETDDDVGPRDGYYLSTANGMPEPVGSEQLAKILSPGRVRPALVGFNLHNSAARTAALAVAHGCRSAIGFQNEFEDEIGEMFFGHLYDELVWGKRDVHSAFALAWRSIRGRPQHLRGSGVVLWSERSVSESVAMMQEHRGMPTQSYETLPESAITIELEKDGLRLHDVLTVSVEPVAELNYSLLHNTKNLFNAFSLRKSRRGVLRDVKVEVHLYIGAEAFTYSQHFHLEKRVTPISDEIHVPLTWDFVRGVDEPMWTTLLVRVSCGAQIAEETTHRVKLLPTNQWKDTQRDGIWLPSFVVPRDPAVIHLVDRARRYLKALLDDPNAGFDGYQGVPAVGDATPDEIEEAKEVVDLQVRALWSAIVYDLDLGYINPPPAYSESSQRIRRPQQILDSATGTCLDLALLIASCLEYVEIYPVIFLMTGHAYVGYWRSCEDHQEFTATYGTGGGTISERDQQPGITPSARQTIDWMPTAEAYEEIVRVVNEDRLVPLESTLLTNTRRFSEAIELGFENLDARDEFDAMVDIRRARLAQVTPLPF